MTRDSKEPVRGGTGRDAPSLVIATILREEGTTGVQTHVQQLRASLAGSGTAVILLTPFSWAKPLTYPVFGARLVLERVSNAASVWWYRHWHEVFLRNALRRELARLGDCVVYAQGPVEARAALRARRGPHQRVVMAVHFRISQADEYAEPGRELKRGGRVFRGCTSDWRGDDASVSDRVCHPLDEFAGHL